MSSAVVEGVVVPQQRCSELATYTGSPGPAMVPGEMPGRGLPSGLHETAGPGAVRGPAPETGDLVLAPGPRVPPLPLARIRQLTDAQCRAALIFLSGYRPAETELAIAAAMTPLSRMGTAR